MPAPASTRTSLWAIASVACGVMSCPPLCVLAIILGVVGLVQVRMRPAITGRGLAIDGITIGILMTAGWGTAFGWWHVNVRRPLLEGPRAPLVAGLGGDVEAFRAAFHEPAPAEETATFLAEVSQRYGNLLDVVQDATPPAGGAREMVDRHRPVVRYRLRFAAASVPAEAEFVRTDGQQWPMVLRWGRLWIEDADRGDLTYPATR